MEEYRDVPGYEGKYSVSSIGNVRNNLTGELLKMRNRPDGYLDVWLLKDKKWKMLLCHRLVLMAFKGMPTKERPLARHLDGTRTNNTAENLEWGTYIENRADRVAHGTSSTYSARYRGQNTSRAVLKDEDVIVIKMLFLMTTMYHREIAAIFGVKREAITKIYNGIRWGHIKLVA